MGLPACDVVEFHRCADGITLSGREGLWEPYPVEYKRGQAQPVQRQRAAALRTGHVLGRNAMLPDSGGCLILWGVAPPEKVQFTSELRQEVRTALAEMHRLYERGYTPKVKPSKACNACSLRELCLPKLMKTQSVSNYLHAHLEDST